MLECNRFIKQKMVLLSRIIAAVLIVLSVAILLAQTAFAKSTYLINDGDRVVIHSTYATDPADILSEAGLALGEDDIYTTQNTQGVSEITVQRKQVITILHGNKTLYVNSYGETVEALLDRMNILLNKGDVLSHPQDMLTYDQMVLTISQAVQTQETYTSLIPYETTYCYDPSLKEGEQVVLTPGVDGRLLCSASVYYVDGKEINRTVNSQAVISQPVNAVVAIGTYVDTPIPLPMPSEPTPQTPASQMPIEGDGVITTASGETLTFTRKLVARGTAYSCDGKPGITYTGTPARVGAIAVDPTVIPLNSRLYIVSNDGEYVYGICTAEDIGGSVKGAWVDLYFDTFAECYEFGMRDCTVYVLG